MTNGLIYYVHVNRNLVIDTPFYKEAVKEYNEAIDRGKRGDMVTLSSDNPNRREFTASKKQTLKLLAGMRL